MEKIKKYSQILNRFLQKIRHKIILEHLTVSVLIFIRFFAVYILFTLLLENIFYLRSDFRKIIWLSYPVIILTFITYTLLKSLIINFGWTKKYSESEVTGKFSAINERIANRFLDSLQLLRELKNKAFSKDLILASIENTIQDIKDIPLKKIIHKKILLRQLKITIPLFALSVIIFLIYFGAFINSFQRLQNYNRQFPVPKPFAITATTAGTEIFSGDTVLIKVQTTGDFPDELQLKLDYTEFVTDKYIKIDSTGFGQHAVLSVTKDFNWEVYTINHSIFKPWRKISSGLHHIKVKDRPEIMNVVTKIHFPDYTGIGVKVKESNNAEYFVMPGSKISIVAGLSKAVRSAILDFKYKENMPLKIQGSQIFGEFIVTEQDEYHFQITDANGTQNINPITYKIKITPDNYPAISLLSPTEDFQLTEEMEIPVLARISDDFGFSKFLIQYKLLKKFGETDPSEQSLSIPIENKKITLQEIPYQWNVNNLNLAPEDGVEFYLEIYDNDIVSGPKKTMTRKISAFFPSLNDLFSNLEKEQEKVEDAGEEILDKLLSSKEVLKDISNKLIKDPNLTWEQKEQLQQEINKTKTAEKDIKKLSEQIKDIQKQGEQNQLFSEETIKKYAELQKAMENIVSPEFKKAMQELQKAIDQVDQKNVEQALKKFSTNHDQFSEELDRMLKLMKRVQIEQSVDELVKRIDDLTRRQDSVTQNINPDKLQENKDWNALQKEEKSIENDTKIFEDRLEQTAEAMQEFPMMNQQALENIQENMNQSGLYENLQNSQKSMQMRDQQNARQNSQQAHEKLSDIQEQMQEFQKDFQQKNMNEITADFQKIIMKSLQLSQSQEALNQQAQKTSRLSDQFVDLAKEQNFTRQNLAKIIQDLTELSRKTFGLPAEASQNIGAAANEMQKAIEAMAERNPYSAKNHGQRAAAALNKLSLSLMKSLDELQKSGESSGFENYMKKMQEMARQQQQLNQDTQNQGKGMPKPQPGGQKPGQGQTPGSLGQLAARQRQIQKSLEKLQQEMAQEAANQAGTLKGIAKDMEDVIKDLENNQVLRKTIERQQKILTRMLDAQKSLRTQSYKKERESITGKDLDRLSPGELPADLGERNILLRQKLEEALKNGYTAEYNEIIRKYFEELAKEESQREE